MASTLGDALAAPPEDGVTRVRFSPVAGDATLLASSWDGTARLYNAAANAALGAAYLSAPLLDCAFGRDASAFYTAGLDGRVAAVDAATLQVTSVLGSHCGDNGAGGAAAAAASAAKAVEWLEPCGLLASAGWDARLCLWDPRCAPAAARVAEARLPGKAFALGACAHAGRLVAAAADRRVCVYDTARPPTEMLEGVELRESSLKYQTRCAAAFGGGYALGSVEGRVAMEVFDASPAAQRRKYAFKCHRRTEAGNDAAFPIHAIAFHPVAHGAFATGGGDGTVCFWDGAHKKRLLQISQYPTGIASLAFSADGTLLAAAASYCWERGPANGANGADDTAAGGDADSGCGGGVCGGGGLFVRNVAEAEVRPKQR